MSEFIRVLRPHRFYQDGVAVNTLGNGASAGTQNAA